MKNIKYTGWIVVLLFSWNITQAQVVIGASPDLNPDKSALLDLKNQSGNSTKGFLLPRVAIIDSTDFTLEGGSRTAGMLIYNTAPKVSKNYGQGLYYWNGNVWKQANAQLYGNNALGWSLTGNTGTTPATNFTGTTDSTDFWIKTHSQPRVTVTSAGNVGVGTTTPSSTLHVNGDMTVTKELKVGGTIDTAGNPGTSGQILKSTGPNTAPEWSDIANITGSTLVTKYTTTVDDITGNSSYYVTLPGLSNSDLQFTAPNDGDLVVRVSLYGTMSSPPTPVASGIIRTHFQIVMTNTIEGSKVIGSGALTSIGYYNAGDNPSTVTILAKTSVIKDRTYTFAVQAKDFYKNVTNQTRDGGYSWKSPVSGETYQSNTLFVATLYTK